MISAYAENFIIRQIVQVRRGGWTELKRKLRLAFPTIISLPFFPLAFLITLWIRLIKPFYLIRIGQLPSGRIGHFAGNIEMYLCERDKGINIPFGRFLDLWYHPCSPCNQQLNRMWSRFIRVLPGFIFWWVDMINTWLPGGHIHRISGTSCVDRDVHNLLQQSAPHLIFLPFEKQRGQLGLRSLGIPEGAPFVCMIVRDSAYLDEQAKNANAKVDRTYHNYRDCNIHNFVMAAEELANRGYYVLRMGAIVKEPLLSSNSKVIDYAANGMRTDFMDIYLGANCEFCISTGTGFDAIPYVFRRPIVYVNVCPFGNLFTFNPNYIAITKHHFLTVKGRELIAGEIFNEDLGFCTKTSDYESKKIQLIENTPEEIRDIVIEMVERLNGTWRSNPDDAGLQRRFWKIYESGLNKTGNRQLHGDLRSRFGAVFLRQNRWWLEKS